MILLNIRNVLTFHVEKNNQTCFFVIPIINIREPIINIREPIINICELQLPDPTQLPILPSRYFLPKSIHQNRSRHDQIN